MVQFSGQLFTPFNTAQNGAIEKIGNRALSEVDRDYGTGWPHCKSGSVKTLGFHGGFHTRNMARAVGILCNDYGVPPSETRVTVAGGKAHDKIQLKPRGVMERESAEWLEEQIRKTKLLPDDVASVVRYLILGTEPVMSGTLVVDQMCNRLSYPSKNVELLAKIVGCGDFSSLNGPSGPYEGHMLFQEIGLPWSKIIEFQEKQIKLRESFHLPIRSAEARLWRPKKHVMAHSYNTLRRLQNGEFTSLKQLIDEDVAFMRKHS